MTQTSPIPRKTTEPATMTFPAAMQEVINGQKITRKEWNNEDYCFLGNPYLSVVRDGKTHTWMINDGDMLAEDWIVAKQVN